MVSGLLLLLAGCGISSTASTPAPTTSPISTATATATPGIPTLIYKIVTTSKTLNLLPNVALPVTAGTNFQWSPVSANFSGLTCAAGGTADPSGAAGHTAYQVFACQLAAGQTTGHGSLLFAEVGSSVPQEIAELEVDALTGSQGSAPDLTYAITTSAQLNGAASVALGVNAGTNFAWSVGSVAGLTCTADGRADPGGPAGHVEYQVFTCQVAAGQAAGEGDLIFAEVGSSTPTTTAKVTLTLG